MSRKKHGRDNVQRADDIELFFVCARFQPDGRLQVLSALHPVVEQSISGDELTALSVSARSVIGIIGKVFARTIDKECGTSYGEGDFSYTFGEPV